MRISELKNYKRELYHFRLRLGIAAIIVLLCFGALLGKLAYLQLWRFDHYMTLAENNRISLTPTPPNRGLIFDRNGIVLAHNFFAYTLEINPSKIENVENTIAELSKIVNLTPNDLKRFKKLSSRNRGVENIQLRSHLNEIEAARFAVNRYRFPGVEIKSRLFRHYPQGQLGAHFLGYINRIDDADMKSLEKNGDLSNYKGSHHIGKDGLEEYYERQLHGTTGFQQVEIDAEGQAVRVLSSTPPVPGNNLILSIDSKLQEIAEKAFGNRRGALVALDPNNGELLALVSMPSFDPNLFVDGIDVDNWKKLNESKDKPLLNRAIKGVYPPGSTLKPFVALAGLNKGLRAPPFTIADPGYFELPGSSHRYRDWKPEGHGQVDMQKAITVSCDTFFYGLAIDLGIEPLTEFIKHFGFGEKVGIDIHREHSGLLPTAKWRAKQSKKKWYLGDTTIIGIGQGNILTTPLQLAYATATLANRGTAITPHLVTHIQKSMDGTITPLAVKTADHIQLQADHMQLVQQGMIDVTRPGGTAASIGAKASYSIVAKTGTAQVIGIKQGEKYSAETIDERHRDHALFIAYAPAESPRIALAIIVENGGHGGSTAGPIAKQVMDYYLLGQRPKLSATKKTVAISAVLENISHD